ncbi:MAG: pSer/pThr/pTyr-binding forkhead associated (FHA) protein [Mariniblastus sp.]|jgi:pSer/pThr/pTyr-binding forkhead associated (FHA) protein
MATITLRVLDGADRGKVYENIAVPVTIGREEGNTIQLNDERISRFHLKIQKDHDDLVLTDLESTNGSKVNNEEVQLRILRHGDLITVGRSTLIFGTRVEINERLERLSASGKVKNEDASRASGEKIAIKEDWQDDPNYQLALLDLDPPKLPERMSPGQAAQLSEVIEFLHMHLRRVVSNVDVDRRKKSVELTAEQWQKILDAQARLAEYLRRISNPS